MASNPFERQDLTTDPVTPVAEAAALERLEDPRAAPTGAPLRLAGGRIPTRGLRRALRWLGAGLGLLLFSAAFWSAVWTWYNPTVELATPWVIERPPSGEGDRAASMVAARRRHEITVLLGGDFAPVDRVVPIARKRGWGYPYRFTASLLRRADVTFLNLEAPVTTHPRTFFLYKYYNYRVDPAALPAWERLGLDVVSLANNHVKDRRERGLRDTFAHLKRAGIAFVGAGPDEPTARRPVIVKVGRTRIGFLAYLQDWWWYNLYLDIFARGDRPGCARFVREDVRQDVKRLRPLVDVLVVSMHWGKNYAPVNAQQERDARFLSSLGVDVIAGHHPHDIQRVEWIGETLVLYSLGNYAWGTPGRASMKVGLLARLRIRPRDAQRRARLWAVDLVPLLTQNRIVAYRPRPIRRSQRRFLRPFLARSRARGARLRWLGESNTLRLTVPTP